MSEFSDNPSYYDDEFARLTEVTILGEQASLESLEELVLKASPLLDQQPETTQEMSLIAANNPDSEDDRVAYLVLQRETHNEEQLTAMHIVLSEDPEDDELFTIIYKNNQLELRVVEDEEQAHEAIRLLNVLVQESGCPSVTDTAHFAAKVLSESLGKIDQQAHMLPDPTESLITSIDTFLAEKKGTTTVSSNRLLENESGNVALTKRTYLYFSQNEAGEIEPATEVTCLDISITNYATMIEYCFCQQSDGIFELEKRKLIPVDQTKLEQTLLDDEAECDPDLDADVYDQISEAGLLFPEQQDIDFMNTQLQNHLDELIEEELKRLTGNE